MGHGAEKPKLGSSCPLICKKCQAGRSGRKSCHRVWVSLPRKQWFGRPQASSSTQRVNQGHPPNPHFPSQRPLRGSTAFPQNCTEEGWSKARLEPATPGSVLPLGPPLPKPVSSSVSSSVRMPALLSNSATASTKPQHLSLIFCLVRASMWKANYF